MNRFRAPAIAAPRQSDRREVERYAAVVPVQVSTRDGVALAGEMTNVSATGFRMRSPIILPLGAEIYVRSQGRKRRRAKVVWQDGAFIGCRFFRQLPTEALEDLLSAPGASPPPR